ncbi:CBS domain-containing protein [Paraglaciecola hydrolytica]|uniref:CBS domain-containing protein n=1 Tax=Paraglaciecola hydrolytica TaxID=1799789 RepID=A0A148KNJ5_9ALTE|nr:CBS domain-containing protein [Paraglaciecola hydrolytica]KXI27829.1 hypothetical protein AX660_20080 [Paraglaciecola hydrolytica]
MDIQVNLQSDLREILAQITLAEAMSKQVLTVYEGWSIKRLSQFFIKHDISGAPVIAADDELVGVVTQSDIIRFESNEPNKQDIIKLVRQHYGPFGGPISEAEVRRIQDRAKDYCTVNSIMTPIVVSIDINSSLEQAYNMILTQQVHRLFITQNGLLVGVLTAMDILRILAQ